MKPVLLLLCTFLTALNLFAGDRKTIARYNKLTGETSFFPEVTIQDVQQVPMDSLLIADGLQNTIPSRWTLQTSPFIGDTVVLTAICVVPGKVITFTATGYTMLLADTATVTDWRGMHVRANTPDSSQLILDGFLNVEQGDIIKITGLLAEFPTNSMNSLTQFQPIAGISIDIIGSKAVPPPVQKTIPDFYTGLFSGGTVHYSTGEPFECVVVELHNLTVDARVNTARGTFSMVDNNGNQITMYDASKYFTLGHGTIIGPADPVWQTEYPVVGTKIKTIRGFITTVSGSENPRGYRIAPIYYGDVVFGEPGNGIITGTKFHDLNQNGVRDSGEVGLSGWRINLSGDNAQTTTTDVNGFFQFTDLDSGNYIISEELQPRWIQTMPVAGSYAVSLAVDDTVNGIDFGNYLVRGLIAGKKFNDLNNNANHDVGEPILPNWRIYLSGELTDSTLTDGLGYYQFVNLDSGDYVVSENQVAGWGQSFPLSGNHFVTLGLNDTSFNHDFGNFQYNSVNIRKFSDGDGNILTDGDRLSKKWNLRLYKDSISSSSLIDSVSSRTLLSVSSLAPATYIAVEEDSLSWNNLGKIVNSITITQFSTADTFYLSAGQSRLVDFINFQPKITLRKFEDDDNNPATIGDQSSKKWALRIYRDSISSGTLVSQVASQESLVVIDPLAGNYIAVESDSAGWNHIAIRENGVLLDVSSSTDTFSYTPSVPTVIDFINFKTGSISGSVFHDIDSDSAFDVGEPLSENWKVTISGALVDSFITDSQGAYSFNNLLPGNYTITIEEKSYWSKTFPKDLESYNITINSAGEKISDKDFGVFYNPKLKLWLTVSTTANSRNVYWGLRSNTAFGIHGVDPEATALDSVEGEFELPPVAVGTFDARFANPSGAFDLFGNGSWTDIRNFLSVSQIDTYYVIFQAGIAGYPVTFRWSKEAVAQAYAGDVTIGRNSGSTTDMKLVDSLVISNTNTTGLYIIAKDPSLPIVYRAGWNMVSVPTNTVDNRRTVLFPTAMSNGFSYNTIIGYEVEDSLNPGIGYWIKFPAVVPFIHFNGTERITDTIDVAEGWNLIGTISNPVQIQNIESIPAGIISNGFFGFDQSYYVADALEPKRAYWTKVDQAGKIILSSESSLNPVNAIRVIPTGELPPPPPSEKYAAGRNEIENFILNQNYPNPFNPTTTIQFDLVEAAYVSLRIFNVLGQEVALLLENEPISAGPKEVNFDARHLSSGVYFYRLEASSVESPSSTFNKIKKMILLK